MGISKVDHKFLVVSIFTSLTALVSALVVYVFPLIFSKFYNPDNWTKGKFLSIGFTIIIILAPIFIIIWDYIALNENVAVIPNPILRVITWYLITFIIGIVPTFFLYFITERSYSESVLQIYMRKNEELENQSFHENKDLITIAGNTKESIEISPKMILYAEVIGNYVTIHFIKNDKFEKKSMRITLSQIIKELNNYPEIVRCHRAFIVNTSYITNVRGNSQGYFLKLYNSDAEIPVSRSYIKIIKDKLNLN